MKWFCIAILYIVTLGNCTEVSRLRARTLQLEIDVVRLQVTR